MDTYVTRYLAARGVDFRIRPLGRPVVTVEDAASERDLRPSQIVKTILLQNREHDVVVAVLPGDRRLDVKRVEGLSGGKHLYFVERAAIEEKLGLVVGAIAPLGEAVAGWPVFVDPAVFDEEYVDISSGDLTAGVELLSRDLRRLLAGATVEVIGQGAVGDRRD